MAPSPFVASVALGARRDCLTVVCSLTLEPIDYKQGTAALFLAQCCRSSLVKIHPPSSPLTPSFMGISEQCQSLP